MNSHLDRSCASSPPAGQPSLGRFTRSLLGVACGLLLASSAFSCAALGIGPSGPPQQKGEPTLSKCVTGSTLEKFGNCGEYCASQNRGCQNYGCAVPGDTKRYGGASFDNTVCAGNMNKGFQCSEPFLGVGAVSCCCTGL